MNIWGMQGLAQGFRPARRGWHIAEYKYSPDIHLLDPYSSATQSLHYLHT